MVIQSDIAKIEKMQGWDAVYLNLFYPDLSLGSDCSTMEEKCCVSSISLESQNLF